MNTKFTSDGRKVNVVGKLNAQESIVQEIFVTQDGAEIPSGENFVVKSLHDAPVISWKEKRIKDIDAQYVTDVEYREKEMHRLKELHNKAVKEANAKIQYLFDLAKNFKPEMCKVLELFIGGRVNYVVTDYCEIEEFRAADNFDGRIRLISLMGRSGGDLSYCQHEYSDGSGSRRYIIPCETMEEAKQHVQNKIDQADKYYDSLVKSANKYNLILDSGKLNVFNANKIKNLNDSIDSYQKQIEKWQETLKELQP